MTDKNLAPVYNPAEVGGAALSGMAAAGLF